VGAVTFERWYWSAVLLVLLASLAYTASLMAGEWREAKLHAQLYTPGIYKIMGEPR
jgi:hypothetical protein